MSYLHRASKHIASSHAIKSHKKPRGIWFVLLLCLIAIVCFFVLKKPIATGMYALRSIMIPKASNEIILEPSARDAELIALMLENEELRKLLGKNVQYPIQQNDIENNNTFTNASGTAAGTAITSSATGSDSGSSMAKNGAVIGTSTITAPGIKIRGNEVVGSVLMRPPQTPYDSLIINVGTSDGLSVGDQVYAFSGFPIGEIAESNANTSVVRLLSAPGNKVEVLIGTSTMAVLAEGKGAGNFYLKLPKVTEIKKGDIVARKYFPPEVFSSIESVDSAEGEAYIYAYFKLPINLHNLVYVVVKKDSNR